MKYRRAWALAFVCVLLDGGITYAAISAHMATEANPAMYDAMEEWGLECAIILSVLTRFVAFSVGIEVCERWHKWDWFVPLTLVPIAAFPVVWNTWVLLPIVF